MGSRCGAVQKIAKTDARNFDNESCSISELPGGLSMGWSFTALACENKAAKVDEFFSPAA